MDIKDYVKPGLVERFKQFCIDNSKDFYSCGIVLTSHLVMEYLAQHLGNEIFKMEQITPEQAWKKAMEQTPYHSGASAAFVAITVARYSIRSEEFEEWCKKEKVVMVKWDEKK